MLSPTGKAGVLASLRLKFKAERIAIAGIANMVKRYVIRSQLVTRTSCFTNADLLIASGRKNEVGSIRRYVSLLNVKFSKLKGRKMESPYEWIARRAAELRNDYGPFDPAELGEAMKSTYGQCAAEMFNKKPESPLELMVFATEVIETVEHYWTQYFTSQAINEYYSECRF